MTRDEIVAFFGRRDSAMARRDAAALAAEYAPDGVLESPWAGSVEGRAAIEQVHRNWFHSFPDFSVHSDDLLIDGDHVAQRLTVVGTDSGGFMGLPPTGRQFRCPLASFCTLRDGEIVHERRIYDFSGLLLQIGVLKAKPA